MAYRNSGRMHQHKEVFQLRASAICVAFLSCVMYVMCVGSGSASQHVCVRLLILLARYRGCVPESQESCLCVLLLLPQALRADANEVSRIP